MSNFYLSDPEINKNNELSHEQYRIYSYCCSQFNVKTMKSFIRLVNIAGQFGTTLEKVQETMVELNKIKVNDLRLISIDDNGKYISFDMPAHKAFITTLGFKKFGGSQGWRTVTGHLNSINTASHKTYLFPQLDQYQLVEKLEGLPSDQFDKITADQLKYGWVLTSVKKLRNNN